MIHVKKSPEPPYFDATVRKPGLRALKELRGDPTAPKRKGRKRKHTHVQKIKSDMLTDYWTACLDDLAAAFNHVCAYSCIRVDVVVGDRTVDHFKPKASYPDDAYEWDNYRFSCGRMNKRKDRINRKGKQVCDPFLIENGWFELSFLTFGLKPNASLSSEDRQRVQETIDCLELDGEEMRKRRAEAWDRFANNPSAVGWKLMEDDCPLVAREYIRQRGVPEFLRQPPP